MGPLSSWTVSSVTLTIWTSCAGEPPEANARAWTGFTRSSLGGELTDEARDEDSCWRMREEGEEET